METYVTDTQALFWHLIASTKLKGRAKRVFEQAERGEAVIVVPAIVWFELCGVVEKEGANVSVADTLWRFQEQPGYDCARMEPKTVTAYQALSDIPDMHDRMIAAVARGLRVYCLTSDQKILKCARVQCIQANMAEPV